MKTKKILAMLLALVMLCTVFAGCNNNDTKTDDKTSETSVADDTKDDTSEDTTEDEPIDTPVVEGLYPGTPGTDEITVILTSEPPKMNSLTMTDTVSFTVLRHLNENLVMLDENDNVIPGCAEKWEMSEDGLNYTFTIREGMTWTNGEPVTAHDFEFAWKTLLAPETAAEYAYFAYPIKNAEAYNAGEGTAEDVGVKATDDYTLEVELGTPTAYFLNLLAFGSMSPINQKFFEEVGLEKYSLDDKSFCTNGPFTLESWVNDDSLVLKKNADFWNASEINVETINFKIITDTNAMLNSFQGGEVDATNLTGEQRMLISQEDYPISNYNDGSVFYLQMNMDKPGLNNVKVREAFSKAIDRETYITSIVKNDSLAGIGFVPEGISGLKGDFYLEAQDYHGGALIDAKADPEAAKALLEEGLAEENLSMEEFAASLTYVCDDGDFAKLTAEFMQEQFRTALGLEIPVEQVTFKERIERSQQQNYTILMGGWGPDYNDPNTFLDMWVSGGGNNNVGYANPAYDELLKAAAVEVDPEKRMEMFYQLEELVCTDLMIIPTYWRKRDFVTSEKITGGVTRTMLQDYNLRYVTLAQ